MGKAMFGGSSFSSYLKIFYFILQAINNLNFEGGDQFLVILFSFQQRFIRNCVWNYVL